MEPTKCINFSAKENSIFETKCERQFCQKCNNVQLGLDSMKYSENSNDKPLIDLNPNNDPRRDKMYKINKQVCQDIITIKNMIIYMKQRLDRNDKEIANLYQIEKKSKNKIKGIDRDGLVQDLSRFISNINDLIENFETVLSEIDSKFELIQLHCNELMEKKRSEIFEKSNRKNSEIEYKLNEQISKMRTENIEMKKQQEQSIIIMDNKLEKIIFKMETKFNKMISEYCSNIDKNMEKLIGQHEYFSEIIMEKLFKWNVNKISEKRDGDEYLWGDIFQDKGKPYNMKLELWANGSGDFRNIGLSIYLYIFCGTLDETLSWPMKANVTIKIINTECSYLFKRCSKYCRIDKPSRSSYSSFKEPFIFLYDDLYSSGIITCDGLLIECFVQFIT